MKHNDEVRTKEIVTGKTKIQLLQYEYWLEYEIASDGSLKIVLPGDAFEMCETGTRESDDKKRVFGYYKFRFIKH